METKTLKRTMFSNLAVGDKFYPHNKDDAESNPDKYWVKAESARLTSEWTNAKNSHGIRVFMKYDTRVWTKGE